MKIYKKILTILLSLVILGSVTLPSFSAVTDEPEFGSIEEYKSEMDSLASPAFNLKKFFDFLEDLDEILNDLFGISIYPHGKFHVEIDETIGYMCDYLCDNVDLDVRSLLTGIPDVFYPAELLVDGFNIDVTAFRDAMNAKHDELESENPSLANIYRLIGAYMSVVEKCEIYATPYNGSETVVQVTLKFTYSDGVEEVIYSELFIDTQTGLAYGPNDTGMQGLGFNCEIFDLTVYAPINCWMRNYGFSVAYDLFCYSSPLWNYATRRFKFDYADKEWMIQIWKGNYLVTNGGEVGIYNRAVDSRGTYYDCAGNEDMMVMTLDILHGDDLIVSEGPQLHWWINGFKIDKTVYDAKALTMKFSIEMKNEEMLEAFCQAIDKHYRHDVTYTVDGLKVIAVW